MSMTRYNIELRTDTRVWDAQIVEGSDMTQLRIQVAKYVGELLKGHAEQVWEDQDWRVDATDETGLILFNMLIVATKSPATALM
jgi:hypothetical protein